MIYSASHKEKDERTRSFTHRKGHRNLGEPTAADVQKKMDELSFSHQLRVQWAEVKRKALFVPRAAVEHVVSGEHPYVKVDDEVYLLSLPQRIFLLFDQPERCFLGEIISFLTMVVIVISCVGYIVATGEKYRPESCEDPACDHDVDLCPNSVICPPEEKPIFEIIETACIAFFSLDYFVRVSLVSLMPPRLAGILPESFDKMNSNGVLPIPEYNFFSTIWRYITIPMNVIDLIAILPFYIAYFTTSGNSVSIIRILRLVRVLRVFKMGGLGNGMTLMGNAMMNSLSAMGILLFFTVLGVILFGSIIFFLESGTFQVTEEYPDGAYLRWNVLRTDREESPFSSILVSCYWAMVTFTTVGYGDLVPTSPVGRFVALILMYTGILVLALPISVIGANFQHEYEKLEGAEEEEEELVYHHNEDDGDSGAVSTSQTPPNRLLARSNSIRKSSIDGHVDRLIKKSASMGSENVKASIDPIRTQLQELTSTCALMMERIEALHRKQNELMEQIAEKRPLASENGIKCADISTESVAQEYDVELTELRHDNVSNDSDNNVTK